MKKVIHTEQEKRIHAGFWQMWSVVPRPLDEWARWFSSLLNIEHKSCLVAFEEHPPNQEDPFTSLMALFSAMEKLGFEGENDEKL